LLGIELRYLSELEVDFDVTVTGFDVPEIDILIEELSPANEDDPADELIEPASGPAVNRAGDIWRTPSTMRQAIKSSIPTVPSIGDWTRAQTNPITIKTHFDCTRDAGDENWRVRFYPAHCACWHLLASSIDRR
jgi:hypothetical protein